MIIPLPRISRTPKVFPPMPSDIPKMLLKGPKNSKGGITSGLISNLAIAALERRLGDDARVDCIVQAEPHDLLLGRVGPVVVKGTEWCSPLGMSCRAIEAKVGNCMLDMASVVQRQKLILNVPARGSALVTFNAQDFGNFLNHPLLKPPQYKYNGEIYTLKFQDNVIIDPKTSSITFHTQFLNSIYKCILTRSANEAKIQVLPAGENITDEIRNISLELSRIVTNYFNSLIFDLEGTFVSYKDMALNEDGEVILELNILVKKFPSRKLKF